QVLADHHLRGLQRRRQQGLERALAPLLGDQAHADRRADEDHRQPEDEDAAAEVVLHHRPAGGERLVEHRQQQREIPALVEQEQGADQVGQRRHEQRQELAPGDRRGPAQPVQAVLEQLPDTAHGGPPCGAWLDWTSSRNPVTRAKRSSSRRRPGSSRISARPASRLARPIAAARSSSPTPPLVITARSRPSRDVTSNAGRSSRPSSRQAASMTAPIPSVAAHSTTSVSLASALATGSSATTRPRDRMMIRSHSASTSARMCDEKISVWLPPRFLSIARIPWTWLGSSPTVGSSSTTSGGEPSSASAIPTRWR